MRRRDPAVREQIRAQIRARVEGLSYRALADTVRVPLQLDDARWLGGFISGALASDVVTFRDRAERVLSALAKVTGRRR